MRSVLEKLVDFIGLVYHEARNVRFPTDKAPVDNTAKYERLTALARNRQKAWDQMATIRSKARRSATAEDAATVFLKHYGLGLEELCRLYENPGWRHSRLGGNKWAAIAAKVREAVEVVDSGDETCIHHFFEELARMRHNTGTLGRKLKQLEASVEKPNGRNSAAGGGTVWADKYELPKALSAKEAPAAGSGQAGGAPKS